MGMIAGYQLPNDEYEGPRLVRREEVAGSTRLFSICFGMAVDEATSDEMHPAYKPPKRGGWYIITHKGVPVSQISISHHEVDVHGGRLRIGSIGGVSTHPDYRGLGLASILLDFCTRKLAEEGARLMLISGGRGLYTRVGNVPAMRFEVFNFERGAALPKGNGLKLRPATVKDAALCARLYQSGVVHYLRSVEDFEKHLSWREKMNWIIENDQAPEAYLFLRTPWEFIDDPSEGVRNVEEYAGSRTALVGALSELLDTEVKQAWLYVPWQDADFIRLLQGYGSSEAGLPMYGHTMRLINFPALLSDLGVYVKGRLPASLRRGLCFEQQGPLLGGSGEDRLTIVRGKERLELDGAVMTQLVMGSDEKVNLPAGALGEIINALFPLPSFLPGLNYR